MHLHEECTEVCIKARSPPASLPFKGQVTEETAVKWSIHEGHEWFSDDSRGRQEILVCLAVLLREQFCRCQDIDVKSYFMGSFVFLSVFSSSEVLAKITSSRSKLPTAACWSWEKREETVKPTCSMSKATSVPQTPQTNHSQCSSPVEALHLILESKSQPVELDNLTIELHVPSRRKKSLQSYCSVDFDFSAFDLI